MDIKRVNKIISRKHPVLYWILLSISFFLFTAWNSFSNTPIIPKLAGFIRMTYMSLMFPSILLLVIMIILKMRSTVKKSVIEIRFSRNPPYVLKDEPYMNYDIGVYNKIPIIEDNVEVWLKEITPMPSNESLKCNLPSRLIHVRGNSKAVTDKSVQINPDSEKYFRIITSWKRGGDEQLMASIIYL